jgi:aspartyl protease family protein
MLAPGESGMTRPIIWATGTLAAVAISATLAGGRVAELVKARASSPASSASAEPAPAPAGDRVLVLQADGRGHFMVHPQVDGLAVRMMVDTGASIVALSAEDAEKAGIRPNPGDFKRPISTANGTVMVAEARIRELRVGDILVRDVEAVVLPAGRLGTSLLGMSFLRRLKGFDMAGGRLTLRG